MSGALKEPSLVIYHAHCPDGFAAAWSCWERWGDKCRYLPLCYSDPLPEVEGEDVWMLDLGLSLSRTQALAAAARSFVLIDHHESAMEELGSLPYTRFDMSKCGGMLAWEAAFPQRAAPRLLEAVQVRDLGLSIDPDMDAVLHMLDSLPYEFGAWSQFAARLECDPEGVIKEGQAMRRKFESLADRLMQHAHPIVIANQAGLALNAPREFAGHIGQRLAQRAPFGFTWFLDGRGQIHGSWRSLPGVNVIPLARQFGGGGHPTASGARLTLLQLQQLLAA